MYERPLGECHATMFIELFGKYLNEIALQAKAIG